jgi:hypothetical protein
VTVDVVVSVYCFGGQIVVVEVRVRVAVNVGRKEYARVWIGNSKTWVFGFVYFNLKRFELGRQFFSGFGAVVFD